MYEQLFTQKGALKPGRIIWRDRLRYCWKILTGVYLIEKTTYPPSRGKSYPGISLYDRRNLKE